MSYLRKQAPPADQGSAGVAGSGGAWSSSLPALVEFLAACQWSDGSPRLPGSLTLFTDQGQWKVCLSDRDQARVAFVTASSPQEALEVAESRFVSGTLDWRAQRPQNGGSRRK
jgi:hypothetical protein